MDCDTDDHGCQGGLPDQAYKFIEFLGGLEEEKDYPYEAQNDQCRLNRTDLKVHRCFRQVQWAQPTRRFAAIWCSGVC